MDTPHLITAIQTTDASIHDGTPTATIHAHLAQQDLLPTSHFVDTAYGDGGQLVASQDQYDIRLVGPTPPTRSQMDPDFTWEHFVSDWEPHQVTCPAHHQSSAWHAATDRHVHAIITVYFRFNSLPNLSVAAKVYHRLPADLDRTPARRTPSVSLAPPVATQPGV